MRFCTIWLRMHEFCLWTGSKIWCNAGHLSPLPRSSQMQKYPHFRVFVFFFVYAMLLGVMFPRLPDIKDRLNVEEGGLGLAIIGMALGTQISLALGSIVVERLGHRRGLALAMSILGLGMALATWTTSPVVFFFFLCLAGLGIGVTEMIINVEADRVEAMMGRRIMMRAHAFWSFGFMATAIAGGLFAQFEVPVQLHVIIMGVAILAATYWLIVQYEPAPKRDESEGKAPLFVRPTRSILVLVTFTLAAVILEGASLDWSTLYMHDVHQTAPIINAATLALFSLVMAVARFFGDDLADWLGTARLAQITLIAAGIGAICVALAPSPVIAWIGFALMGFGVSAIFPMAMSVAAQSTDRPSTVNVAALAQLSFVAFLLAPPILGFVGEHFGLRASYGVGLPFVLGSMICALLLTRRGQLN